MKDVPENYEPRCWKIVFADSRKNLFTCQHCGLQFTENMRVYPAFVRAHGDQARHPPAAPEPAAPEPARSPPAEPAPAKRPRPEDVPEDDPPVAPKKKKKTPEEKEERRRLREAEEERERAEKAARKKARREERAREAEEERLDAEHVEEGLREKREREAARVAELAAAALELERKRKLNPFTIAAREAPAAPVAHPLFLAPVTDPALRLKFVSRHFAVMAAPPAPAAPAPPDEDDDGLVEVSARPAEPKAYDRALAFARAAVARHDWPALRPPEGMSRQVWVLERARALLRAQ